MNRLSMAQALSAFTLIGALLTTNTLTTYAATITVTTTAASGGGSLRQAILDANTSVGVLDTISFAIPGDGPHTITPASQLPTISNPVIIDGYTQPCTRPNTFASGNDAVIMIELRGSTAGRVPAYI